MAADRGRSKRAGAKKPKAAPNDAASKSRPRKLKPAPPVTDCAKCQKLAEAKREATRLRREVERLLGLEKARTLAALAGGPITLSDEQITDAFNRVYCPSFDQVLRVPVEIALSPAEDAQDRLKATQMITERIAGKVPDKHHLSGKLETGPVTFVSGLPEALTPAPAAAADPPGVTP